MDPGNVENGSKGIQFKHFDVVPEAKDHHYLHSNKLMNYYFNNGNVPKHSTIMREWRILENSLPESIYVQAYETRIDLLRAVIIGSAGTPYHDGLFFFDILLPSNYPNQPPEVYYHSHGYDLNPNLYADGTVCLSLINTMEGSKVERWTNRSTILQILVSIQGLVLNERPYFNEPGYEHAKTSASSLWINSSTGYNQHVFTLSCKTMLHTIRQPPGNFEDFVVQHFRGRAASILAAIEHYQKGHALVGQFQTNAAAASSSSTYQVSSNFKADLMNIQVQFSNAFAHITSDPNKDKALTSTPMNAKEVREDIHEEDQCMEHFSFAENILRRIVNEHISFAEDISRRIVSEHISFAEKISEMLLDVQISFAKISEMLLNNIRAAEKSCGSVVNAHIRVFEKIWKGLLNKNISFVEKICRRLLIWK